MPDMAEYRKAIAYFASGARERSFELRPGAGRVILSAPHAVSQTRDGRIKDDERYTGALALLLSAELSCHAIVKTRNMGDDANRDAQSDYRDAVCGLIKRTGARYLLDLHQLSPARPMALCIGTGRGENLLGEANVVDIAELAFERRGLAPVTIDEPFAAMGENTVCRAAARAGAVSLLMELNTRLVQQSYREFALEQVYAALREIVTRLNDSQPFGYGKKVFK